jgi:pimeloyl-ACP methyl ester carboxylesterase
MLPWVAGLVAGVGLAYQANAEHRDHRRFPRDGDLIAVGLHQMHLYCTGQGGPAVTLEAPAAGLSALWRPVQEAVSRFTRVCSYDRAGFGWSEPGPAPRTSKQIALELHALLTQAGVPRPYVPGGSVICGIPRAGLRRSISGGGWRRCAGRCLASRPGPARLHLPENQMRTFQKWEPFIPVMRRFGILRIGLHDDEPALASLPKDVRGEVLYLREKTNSYRTLYREGAAWAESADQVRKSGDLGAKPLIVLTGGRVAEPKWRAIWVDGLQAEMAHLSSRGKQIVLGNSGHGIQFEAPDAVADAIQEICNVVHADEIKK